jgi:hypothetical protein
MRMIQAAAVSAVAAALSGCLSPVALDRAVIAYDTTTTDVLSRQLLLNIARARHHQSIHFTGVSNIAATFNFQASAGVSPPFTGNSGTSLVPVFGGSVTENPTISIVPIEGEEFTKRLLTPLQENKLTLLLRQGVDIDLLLRLTAGEFRVRQGEREVAYANRPSERNGYAVFRRVVVHLSSVQDRNELYVEPMIFDRRWTLPASAMTAEGFQSLEKEYSLAYDARRQVYQLSKPVTGRILITNYDPGQLPPEERMRLNDEAEKGAPNDLAVDIRPGYPGGEYPLHGKFRLRSFHNVLNFLGRGLAEDPEYDVAQDPRTPKVTENPARTMALSESASVPAGADLSVRHHGRYYALRPERGYQWNREGFRLLYQLFQMTLTELPQSGVPSITISK